MPEARIERTAHGLVPRGEGWWILNGRDAQWRRRPGRGHSLPLSGWTDEECETIYDQLGVNLLRLEPGEPIGFYHWEADQEDFLVLDGEAVLVIEGEERPLRAWDFVHCPPGTQHVIVGAGDGPCLVLATGSREHIGEDCNGGAYTVDPAAARHGAAVAAETSDASAEYAALGTPEPAAYGESWLPDLRRR